MSIWKTLLETAIYTPSPHNVQPWRLRILSEESADLLIDRRRTLPKEDPTGNFIILTMGLFIEALRILAANRSLKLEYELYSSLSQFTPEHIAKAAVDLLPYARLTLAPGEQTREIASDDGHVSISEMSVSSLHHAQTESVTGEPWNSQYDDSLFLTRRTSRISFLPQPLPNDAIEALSNLAHAWGQTYKQVTEPETIEQILNFNIDALFEDLNTPAYHDEIVQWFRFTDRSARRTRDGLDYRCMNSSRISFWLAARVPHLLQLPVTRPLLKKIYRRQLGNVPSVGMLAGPFWEPDSAFDNGRFLMHFWLELARRDLYIHPYGNLVTNKAAAESCLQTVGLPQVWLIFRIGFSKAPPQSYRRSVEEVLVD
jgi:nitroreductase